LSYAQSGFVIGVVDDDPRVLESLESLLESAGHGVRRFASAAALLESRAFAEIDCLVSDIDMPVMDGFALLQAARTRRPQLPVIFITAHPEMLNRSLPSNLAPQRWLMKPFTAQQLLSAVSDTLS
jgi:CheY-like chemotaxis protein